MSFTAAFVDETMHSADREVVCLVHKAVCHVDHERAGNWRSLDPVTLLIEYFKAATIILSDQCKALKVGMCSNSILVRRTSLLLRIVDEAHSSFWTLYIVVKIALGHMQR